MNHSVQIIAGLRRLLPPWERPGTFANPLGPVAALAVGLLLWGAPRAAGAEPTAPTVPAPAAADPSTPPAPSRVTVVHDSAATGNYVPDAATVHRLFRDGLAAWSGKSTPRETWSALVQPSDVVGIKVVSAPGPASGSRLPVVEAVVMSLIEAGHPPARIVLWDKSRTDLQVGGYAALAQRLGVRYAGAAESGWDAGKFYETSLIGRPVYGDLEFNLKTEGVGRKSHVTRLLTQDITRLVSVAPVLNHNLAGVHGHLTSLALGSVDNTLRFEGHQDRLAEAIPEIYAMPEIADKVVLCITDALLCQYRGEERALLHYAVPLNELRFSTDPVALDALALLDIERSRMSNPMVAERAVRRDLFVNAALLELGNSDTNRIQVGRVR